MVFVRAAILLALAFALVGCGRAPQEPIQRTVTINGTIDGTLVDPVRLWSHPTSRDRVVAQLRDGDQVGLVRVEGDRALVRTAAGVDGWLMVGFIKELSTSP